ncbi:MAG: hypothetical protein ABUS54_07585 [Actinomycetota bacterium]
MKTARYLALAVLAAAVVAASATAAPKKSITVSGTYTGTASTKVDGSTATIAANGSGSLTLLGASKLVGNGTGDSSQQPCVPFAGTGTITGPGGVITYKVPTGANGCGDEGGHVFAIKGMFQVVKATGKLAKAKGSIRFSGTYNHDDGSFSVKLTGSLTK